MKVMKTMLCKKWIILFAVSFAFSALGCSKAELPSEDYENGNVDLLALRTRVDSYAKDSLSDIERTSLLLMREEEKLARDVYNYLYGKWGSRVFQNISSSEQTHMDAVLMLLQKYGIEDPVGSNEPGKFLNNDLQKLYNQLTALGQKSVQDAFNAGATIEDLDIYDLKRISKQVDNQDILLVYGNLERGSRNHMRAFTRNIEKFNASYTPQYITREEYDAIINSEMERGQY
jgi:hypothetical protein